MYSNVLRLFSPRFTEHKVEAEFKRPKFIVLRLQSQVHSLKENAQNSLETATVPLVHPSP